MPTKNSKKKAQDLSVAADLRDIAAGIDGTTTEVRILIAAQRLCRELAEARFKMEQLKQEHPGLLAVQKADEILTRLCAELK